jgi:hypothetical protein
MFATDRWMSWFASPKIWFSIASRLRNLKSGNFEFACSRILAFPFGVGFGLGDPIVVDLDQHGGGFQSE